MLVQCNVQEVCLGRFTTCGHGPPHEKSEECNRPCWRSKDLDKGKECIPVEQWEKENPGYEK